MPRGGACAPTTMPSKPGSRSDGQKIEEPSLVRNLPGFARFLPVAALLHAQVLNVAGLARDAGVARTTVAAYLESLADTHLTWQLPAFEGRLLGTRGRHPGA